MMGVSFPRGPHVLPAAAPPTQELRWPGSQRGPLSVEAAGARLGAQLRRAASGGAGQRK